MGDPDRPCYRVDDLILDVGTATVERDGKNLEITGLTFDLLVYLVETAPLVATREDLFNHLWPEASVGEETLKQRIKLLRKALGEDSKQPRYVQTVRGKGYKLIAPVKSIERSLLPQARRLETQKSWLYSAVVLPVLLIAAVVWLRRETPPPRAAVSDQLSHQELFDRGSAYYHRYLPGENDRAIHLLTQAVALKPDFAEAQALLSRAYSQQNKLGNGYWGGEAKAHAERAIEAAPNDPEGYVALGVFYDVAGRPEDGLAAYQKALDLDQHQGTAWGNGAYDLMMLGRLDEALHWNVRGLELVPEARFAMVQMGDILRLLGFSEKAETWFEKAITLQPDNTFAYTSLVTHLLAQGRLETATQRLKALSKPSWGANIITNRWGDLHYISGALPPAETAFAQTWQDGNLYGGVRLATLRREQADDLVQQLADRLEQAFREGYQCADFHYYRAQLYLVHNHHDQALEQLLQAKALGWLDVAWWRTDPALKTLRNHPRFVEMLQRIEQEVDRQRKAARNQGLVP